MKAENGGQASAPNLKSLLEAEVQERGLDPALALRILSVVIAEPAGEHRRLIQELIEEAAFENQT